LSDAANSPAFAVGVGLIVYGSKNIPSDSVYRKTGNVFGEYFKALKKWFLEFF
jgi:cell division protein FtsA